MCEENRTEDEILIQNYLAGDAESFDELYARYKKPLYAYLNRLLQDRALADDLFQQTWIKVLNRLEKYESKKKFFAWLSMIAHNLAIDHFRRAKNNAELPLEEEAELPDRGGSNEPWRNLHNRELKKALERATGALPGDLREVFLLRQEGISFKEIADIQKCTLNTVLGRMRYALLNLRKQLQEWNS